MAAIDQPPTVVCSVVREQTGDRLQIRGRLIGQEDLRGTYSLRIRKIGPSGSSTVNQGGPFSASANAESFVGLANFNTEPGTTIVAEFSLLVGDQTHVCASGGGESP
jgi:hypothetical protein